MSVFYEDSIGIIYNSKMEDIIDTLNFNIIITDPPYNCNYKYPDYKDNLKSDEYIQLLSYLNNYKSIVIHYPEAFCGDVGEALGRPEKLVQWVYNSNLNRQHRSIAWFGNKPDFNKVKQPYKNPNDKRIKELIKNGNSGSRLYDWWDDINIVKNISKDKEQSFTNQIPIKLLERIILISTNENDIILDPFFGSGSLYFACKNTGRRCIGIEQSLIHLESFKNRLNK